MLCDNDLTYISSRGTCMRKAALGGNAAEMVGYNAGKNVGYYRSECGDAPGWYPASMLAASASHAPDTRFGSVQISSAPGG